MTIDIDNPTEIDVESEVYLIFLEDGEHPNGAIGVAKRRFKRDYGFDDARANILFNYNAMYYVTVTKAFNINWFAMRVLRRNRQAVKDYQNDVDEAINFLVADMMDETDGLYDPTDVQNTLETLLGAIPDGETL